MAVAACAGELADAVDFDAHHIVISLKKKLLGPAARAAREAGLRRHARVLVLLQVGLPLVHGENLTTAQRDAIAYTCSLVGQPTITNEESRQAERLLRQVGISILDIPVPDPEPVRA